MSHPYSLIAQRLGVRIYEDTLANDVHLTKRQGRFQSVITYDHRLPAPMRIAGIGLLLGVVALGWGDPDAREERFGLRFTPPWAAHQLRRREREVYLGYRAIRRWLAPILVTDEMRRELEFEQRSIYDLCYLYDIPRDIVEVAFGLAPFDADRIAFEEAVWDSHRHGW